MAQKEQYKYIYTPGVQLRKGTKVELIDGTYQVLSSDAFNKRTTTIQVEGNSIPGVEKDMIKYYYTDKINE